MQVARGRGTEHRTMSSQATLNMITSSVKAPGFVLQDDGSYSPCPEEEHENDDGIEPGG